MKILHILAHAERGGCEKNCYHFIRSMPEFAHEVIVLSTSGPMVVDWESLHVKVSVLNILQYKIFRFYNLLNERLPNGAFDKVIVWTSIRMPLVLHSLNKYSSAIYIHFGNPVISSQIGKIKNVLFSKFLSVTNKVYLRPVSQFVQTSLEVDPYYRGFQNKVSLKPISTVAFQAKNPTRHTNNSAVQFGMVARLDGIKDHSTVIKAFSIIKSDYPFSTLHLVGDGELKKKLGELCIMSGLQHDVIFHGDVNDIYRIAKDWDMFLYATTLQEGLGGTIPEALSLGLPVVSVDLPMIREWDIEGNFITYCLPNNPNDMALKAIGLLRDFDRRVHLFDNSPSYIKANFSPERFSSNYIA